MTQWGSRGLFCWSSLTSFCRHLHTFCLLCLWISILHFPPHFSDIVYCGLCLSVSVTVQTCQSDIHTCFTQRLATFLNGEMRRWVGAYLSNNGLLHSCCAQTLWMSSRRDCLKMCTIIIFFKKTSCLTSLYNGRLLTLPSVSLLRTAVNTFAFQCGWTTYCSN